MPLIPVNAVGPVSQAQFAANLGVNDDLPDHRLPPEVWTTVRNIRFEDTKAVKMLGHAAIYDPPTVAPYWGMPVPTDPTLFWIYMGLDDAYAIEASAHSKITRASGVYTGAAVNKWDGGVFGGIPVVNNGVDVPQAWTPVSASQLLVDLANWPASTFAKIVKPFKSYLVALHVTESGTIKPHKVRWSHTADPGTVPTSWVTTDNTVDAGEVELSDTHSGTIQHGAQLNDVFIIYKNNSTWEMQFIGGQFIFRFRQIFSQTGCLAQRCVAVLPDTTRHFVLTGDDVILHNGVRADSILDKRMKKFLQNNIDPTNFASSYCVLNPMKDEAWACFPEIGQTLPSLALIYNYRDGSLGLRELADAEFMVHGPVNETATESWDSDSDSWDSDTTIWNLKDFNEFSQRLVQFDPTNTKIFQLDRTNQFNGTNFTALLERTGLAIIGRDRNGNPIVDLSRRKIATRIRVRATGSPFDVQIGSQETPGGAVTWANAKEWIPGTTKYLDFIVEGMLLAVRFESTGNVAWEFEGYDIEIELLGVN